MKKYIEESIQAGIILPLKNGSSLWARRIVPSVPLLTSEDIMN